LNGDALLFVLHALVDDRKTYDPYDSQNKSAKYQNDQQIGTLFLYRLIRIDQRISQNQC
jgi:hypothetical protein